MPTATLPPNAMAVGSQSKLSVLGYLVWFSVPDQPVRIKNLRKQWLIAGLDPSPLPRDPNALSLFKRAMRDQAGKVKHDDGTSTHTDVQPVLENGDFCIYQISRVVRDAENREVDYPKAMRCVFLKESEEIKFDPLGGVPRKDLIPVMNAITDYYEGETKTVRGPKVRTLIRKFIRDDSDEQGGVVGLGGENLRGKAGGVYFVAARHENALDGLEMVLEGLHPDGSGYLHKVPMADTSTERELIRRHHLDNTKRELAEAVAEVSAILKRDRTRQVRPDVVAQHWRKLKALRRRSDEYKGLLHEENEDIRAADQMLERQLEKLSAL